MIVDIACAQDVYQSSIGGRIGKIENLAFREKDISIDVEDWKPGPRELLQTSLSVADRS